MNTSTVELSLPAWVKTQLNQLPKSYNSTEEMMELAIDLSRKNIEHKTGGPFGAAVFSESGELISVGVNIVVPGNCSLAHAETMAIMLAQKNLETFDLASRGLKKMTLATSAQPCIQCFGSIWWSGISKLIYGANADEVIELTGFEEGPLPDQWQNKLANRHKDCGLPEVEVVEHVMSKKACEVLAQYKNSGGQIYNAGSN